MEIFKTIKLLLRITAIDSFDHPKSEWIKWVLRFSFVSLLSYGIVAFAYIVLFNADKFFDRIEPALAVVSYVYCLAVYSILLWKRAAVLELIEELQLMYDRGNILPTLYLLNEINDTHANPTAKTCSQAWIR